MKKIFMLLIILITVSSLANAQHSNPINITWVPSGDPPLKFLILRSSTTGGPYTTICDGTGQPVCPTGAPTASFVDNNVKAGDVWFYVTRASNAGGLGPLSNEKQYQTPFLPPTTAPVLSGTAQ